MLKSEISKDIKMATRPISVYWFKNRDQYDSCIELLTDSWVLPDDYRDWLIRFNQMIDRYERSGIEVIKVDRAQRVHQLVPRQRV
jgi:hypothetical protein